MLEGDELEKAIKVMLDRLRAVNTWYIKKIASQIKKIGELSQSSINRLVAMSEMYANINDINEQLRIATGANIKTLRKIYEKALAETYTDPRFKAYLAAEPDALRPEAEKRIEQYVQGVYRQTAGAMINLSNTTAITPMYADAVDKAILSASTGVGSYTEAMRDTIRKIGQAGMQVVYESGYHRRLDTAVRQNIVDGVNQINKNASIMIGEELRYDAIEISAHARSAPDHEPVQGHIFLKEEFEKLQSGLMSHDIDGRVFQGFRRPIGEWNCRHTPMSFSTQWSKRKWTDEQLRQFIDDNHKGCTINGKHKTLYEAMQMMRDIETAVRREKDTAVAAQAAGDDALRQQCQRNINALVRHYAEIAKASGNAEKRQRMTVEGFKPVKVPPGNPEKPTNNPQPPDNSQKGLTSGGKSDTISIKVDSFVPCLKDAKTGEILPTEVAKIPRSRLKEFTEAGGWGVDWKDRPRNEYTLGVFLKDDTNPQGLISLRRDSQGVYMAFASTAPHNNKDLTGGTQKYIGVGGHLFAAAIEESVKAGTGGCVFGWAVNKEVLAHYIKEFGAIHIPIEHQFQFMIADEAAKRVIDIYTYERRH